jgi:hypothetical protein
MVSTASLTNSMLDAYLQSGEFVLCFDGEMVAIRLHHLSDAIKDVVKVGVIGDEEAGDICRHVDGNSCTAHLVRWVGIVVHEERFKVDSVCCLLEPFFVRSQFLQFWGQVAHLEVLRCL